MSDDELIMLFLKRDECAIAATEQKYGALLMSIAVNILRNREEAEETVNDTLLKIWQSIPPERPRSLRAYAASVAKHRALDEYRRKTAKKRSAFPIEPIEELNECIPSSVSVENSLEGSELSAAISRWLRTLDPEQRALFIRRYWYAESVDELSRERGADPKKTARQLFGLRAKLKKYLEKEGEYL